MEIFVFAVCQKNGLEFIFVWSTCVHFRCRSMQNGVCFYQIYNVVWKFICTHHPMKRTHTHAWTCIVFAIERRVNFTQHYSEIAQVFCDWSSRQTKDVEEEKEKTKRAPIQNSFAHWFNTKNKALDGGITAAVPLMKKSKLCANSFFCQSTLSSAEKNRKKSASTYTPFPHSNRSLYKSHTHWFKWIAMSCAECVDDEGRVNERRRKNKLKRWKKVNERRNKNTRQTFTHTHTHCTPSNNELTVKKNTVSFSRRAHSFTPGPIEHRNFRNCNHQHDM